MAGGCGGRHGDGRRRSQYYSHRQAVAEAERVQNDVRLALHIAGEKLALLQRKLQEPHR